MSGNTIQVWGGTQWYPIDTGVIVPPGSTDSPYVTTPLQKALPLALTAAARLSNPRVNPVMTTPPTITVSGTHDATLTNQIGWNGIASIYDPPSGTGPFNFYGGFPTTLGWGAVDLPSVHLTATNYTPVVKRMEINADAVKVEVEIFAVAVSGTNIRVIVDGQYASLTPTTVGATNFLYLMLDFTAAGGRKMRNIIVEGYQIQFGSYISVGPTSTLQKPGSIVRKLCVEGDSFLVSVVTSALNCFPYILGDYLGMRNTWNGGVPGTGYLATDGTSLTIRQRIRDMVDCAPDLLLITAGYNDVSLGLVALQAEVTTTLRTLRTQPTLSQIPVILCPFGGSHSSGLSGPAETAIRAGSAALNDPNIYFISTVNSPNGAWMTGTGNTGAPTGSGNCDIYIGPDGVHPNDAGHVYLAGRLADEITRLVSS
jgi:lysophospholipase L1-like esterase